VTQRLSTLLLLMVLAVPARAWTYGDTLTVVWKPLPTLPAIVRPTDTLAVWANAPSSATGWSASLRFGALTVPLAPAGGGFVASKSRWELGFVIPVGTPEEIYDLQLASDATAADTSRHSVKVIPAFRTSYYFAQISDTHLPEHAFSDGSGFSTADTSGMADFDTVIDDLNLIHPEFILHTGDLVNEGELEEYLGMYEMGRAKDMLSRLRDPVFVTSGNHDIGGWQPTPPPDGTSRKNWWRYFGWPYLGAPPPGEHHSQDYSFDYGLLHAIGMEAYINSGSYDHYMQPTWGAQSMTTEQMGWLAFEVAAVPPGHTKIAFFHYDFGGTLANGQPAPNFSQFSNPAALGLDGVLFGHNHGIAEATPAQLAAHPFNLGIRSVIDNRTFRIFRVNNGVITPGIMHRTTAAADSLTLALSGPNDGTRARLTANLVNRYGETWEHARLVFNMVDDDSLYGVTGGTVVQTVRQGGAINVYVDCVLPGNGALTVLTIAPTAPIASVGPPAPARLALAPPSPNPFRFGAGALRIRFALPQAEPARIDLFDIGGRRLATLLDGPSPAGERSIEWGGAGAAPGVYLVRLTAGGSSLTRRVLVLR